MATVQWKTASNGSWTDGTNWDSGAPPGAGDDAVIGIAGTYTVTVDAAVAAASLTLSDPSATLLLQANGGATATISGDVTNAGTLALDQSFSAGGSTLAVGGTLTNTGALTIGSSSISSPSTVSVGALVDTGTLSITGNGANEASLLVAAAAPDTLSDGISLNGNALLQYASGEITTIASGVTLLLNGGARVADASDPTTNSALTALATIAGALDLENGTAVTIDGDVDDTGTIVLDQDFGAGNSSLTITGTLTDSGTLKVGGGSTGAPTTVSVGDLVDTGALSINAGGSADEASLLVAAAAPGTLANSISLGGNALLQYASGEITTIASGVTLLLNGDARVADASDPTTNSALTALATIAGALNLEGGAAVTIDGDVDDTGSIVLDQNFGAGNSSLTVTGTLTDTGTLEVGGGSTGAPTTVSVGNLVYTGSLSINAGGASNQASLIVAAAAPDTLTNNVSLNNDSLLQYASGEITTIASGVTLLLNGDARVADASDPTTNSALTSLTTIAGTLNLENGAAVTIDGDVDDTGTIVLDQNFAAGNSSLTVTGTLTDTGTLEVGGGSTGAPTTVSVGNLVYTGSLSINAGGGADQASLIVAAAAPDTLTNNVSLNNESLLQYASGEITTIASGVTLLLNGDARVADASDPTTNSALTSLTTIAGTLNLEGGAAVTIDGDVDDTGTIVLDQNFGTGNSSLTVTGTLTDSGTLEVGGGSTGAPTTVSVGNLVYTGNLSINAGGGADQASLIIAAAAPDTLTNNVSLNNESLLEYGSGEITTIASGVTLLLNGDARVADASDPSTNSALTSLTTIAGTLNLESGAAVTIDGDVDDTGSIVLDQNFAAGNSSLTVTGTLTDTGTLEVGGGSTGAPTTVSVGNLVYTGNLSINAGGGADQASLIVAAAAPDTLTNNVSLNNESLLEYGSGEITTIASGVTLLLNGDARVADASDPTTNSALTSLATVAGTLNLESGAAVTIDGDVDDTGTIVLDQNFGTGNSTLTITGTLTDSGTLEVGGGSTGAPTTVSVGNLVDTGSLSINAGGGANQASLLVAAAAPDTLADSISLNNDSLLQYGSGEITTIASGVTLLLNGDARVADASDPTTNSALTGLATVAGTLNLESGAAVTIDGDVDDTGSIVLDQNFATGNSSLTITGTLTDAGTLSLGTGTNNAPVTMSVGALVDTGALSLSANSPVSLTVTHDATVSANLSVAGPATLSVGGAYTQSAGTLSLRGGTVQTGSATLASGTVLTGSGTLSGAAIEADGTVTASGGTLDLAGPITGAGSLQVGAQATLELGGADAEGVSFVGADATLQLDQAAAFTGLITGLAFGDTLALTGITATSATASYDSDDNISTLTVAEAGGGNLTFQLSGDYAGDLFSPAILPSGTDFTFITPADPVIATNSPIAFGDLHVGAAASQALTISNDANSGAPGLDAHIGATAGAGTGSGTITQLAPGATNSTSITVGLATGAAGMQTGTVTIDFASDSAGNATPLTPQTVSVTGTVWREADPVYVATPIYLHVGDPASAAFTITNADPADGFSESLQATVQSVTGSFTGQTGSTGLIAPGATDSSLTLGVSTAAAGTYSGVVTVDAQSVATGADTLGTTDLGTQAVAVTVHVDNHAAASFVPEGDAAAFTQSGSNAVIDLGTIAAGSGPLTAAFGVTNTANGPADVLSGSFTASGSWTASSLAAFAGLAAGQTDSSPVLTLDTTQTGEQVETITLTPQGSNASGFDETLPTETLTVEADVEALPPPTITAQSTLDEVAAIGALLPISIADPNDLTQPVTVVLSDTSGTLTAAAAGHAVIAGSGTQLTITGSVSDINATLASLAYTAPHVGTDTVSIAVSDQYHASATSSVVVTTISPPDTGVVINAPITQPALIDSETGLNGLSLSDPAAEASGTVLTLTLNTQFGTLSVKNPSDGAVIGGDGTDTVTLTGTIDQINASLADDGIIGLFSSAGLIEFLESVVKHEAVVGAVNIVTNAVTGSVSDPLSPEDIISSALGGPEGKFFSVGVTAVSTELNILSTEASGADVNVPATLFNLAAALLVIVADAHIVEPDGTIFDFNPVGEFLFATSTQSGDSFQVQVRLQPVGTSQSASIVTQVAASLGNDRITFDSTRANVVYVNGTAVTLTNNTPDVLSGGEVTQVNATTWSVSWNTGEVLTVNDGGGFLNVKVTPGPNDPVGSIQGLINLAAAGTGDLQLPDGTVLPSSVNTAQLYQTFANDWRVPQQFSLFDYGPGQTTANFTDTSFPSVPIVLADLPADVVAAAAAVAKAAGITDPGVLAAAEFDYIASGGNTAFVQSDANFLANVTTTVETVTNAGPVPVAIGISPIAARVMGDGTDPLEVTFEVYLTAAATTDTTIDYTAVDAGAGFLSAADFGGTLPSGSVTIAAGQTEAAVTLAVAASVLGTQPSAQLAIGISSPSGDAVFAGQAQTTLAQPVAGPPPVPVFEDLTRFGTFTQTGPNSYTLNLGDVQYAELLPPIELGIVNAATGNSDALSGSFTVAPVDGFTVTGASLPSALAAGDSYVGIDLGLSYSKLGPDSETITFNPQDTNNTGFSASLPPVTLTITDNIVVPSMVFSEAWGDVHIITYSGLTYDFQEVGEFTLAKSTLPGDSFDIQLRLQPWSTSAVVSVITQVGVSVGTDDVTFDLNRADEIEVNGVAVTLSPTNDTITLNGGTLTYISPNTAEVKWNTGEQATVVKTASGYLNVIDGIPLSAPETVEGIQGSDAGQANDLQLPDGTVLAQPLTYDELHHEFADGWRITQQDSLLNYGPGQTTATFTDVNFPADVVQPGSAPPAEQEQAAALVAAAGITDPGIAAAAEEDYIATNDPDFIATAAMVQAQTPQTTPVTVTGQPAPAALAGVEATAPQVVQNASGTTPVSFTVFLTQPTAADTTVDYTVVDGGAGFLGAAAFGGSLPTGSVVVQAGQSSATLTLQVPMGALGTAAAESLEVQINSADTAVMTPTATVRVVNQQQEPGLPAIPLLSDLTDPGLLVQTGAAAYTLNLGTLGQNMPAVTQQLQLLNGVGAGGNSLGATFTAPLGAGFLVTGNTLANALQPGQSYGGLRVTAQTAAMGDQSETLTLTPIDENASGFSADLPTITLTIEDTVGAMAAIGLNTPGTVLLPNVHVGDADSQVLSVTNTAAAPAASLAVTPVSGGSVTADGSIAALAAGQTDASSITASLSTAAAGQFAGIVGLEAASNSAAGPTALPGTPDVDVYGSVYRLAAPMLNPVSLVLHVGDPGHTALTISNGAAADGFSETLDATLAGTTGAITDPQDSVQLAPGANDSSSLGLGFSTAQAGVQTGTATVDLASDGTALDGLGVTQLAAQTVPVSITVNNYAQSTPTVGGVALQAGAAPNSYVLNLGTIQQGSTASAVELDLLNSAAGPADDLNASFAITGDPAFTNTGFSAVSSDADGSAAAAGTIALDTDTAGTFNETITVTPSGSNSSGFSGALATQTITVTGTIAPTGMAGGDVHLVSYDGQRYDFQALGDFTLSQSTTGDGFAVQMETSPWMGLPGTSIATSLAARVGGDVVQIDASGTPTVNGVADTALAPGATQLLEGGTLSETGWGDYTIAWNSGETLQTSQLANFGAYLNTTVSLGPQDAPGSVQGLLGGDEGVARDFQLPDGTVLTQPSDDEIAGAYADAWRVAPGTSLLGEAAAATAPITPGTVIGSATVGFIAAPGATLAATAPDTVLTGSLGATGGGVTLAGSAGLLASGAIANLSSADVIDVTDIAPGTAWASYVAAAGSGTLTVGDAGHAASITLAGGAPGASLTQAADGHGGTLFHFG